MARVPITVMGYRCERCCHEWIPKNDRIPKVCPNQRCHSAYWDSPKKSSPMLTYESFRDSVQKVLKGSGPITWTEIRTTAKVPQAFPNNKWVRRLEQDISLKRNKDTHGIIKWTLD